MQARGGGGARRARASSSSTAACRGATRSAPGTLPYGDQRRLEVARALATDPKLLLLDEPTAGMNPQETADFTAFVRARARREGLTVLLIEHDMKVVMGVSERITVLEYGAKIAEGTPAEVQARRARDRGLPRQGRGGVSDGDRTATSSSSTTSTSTTARSTR